MKVTGLVAALALLMVVSATGWSGTVESVGVPSVDTPEVSSVDKSDDSGWSVDSTTNGPTIIENTDGREIYLNARGEVERVIQPAVTSSPTATPPPTVLRTANGDETIKKVIHVDGRDIGLDRHGKVVKVGNKTAPVGHYALQHQMFKGGKNGTGYGIVSRGFVEARDAQTLGWANGYTDQRVGALSMRVWIALGLSALAIILAVIALLRRPHFRRVHY